MNFMRFFLDRLNGLRHILKRRKSIFSLSMEEKYRELGAGKLFFFDSDFYLASNIDVRASHIDPLYHYIENGWKEGRSPSRYFDVQAFSKAHPGLKRLNIDLAAVCIKLYGSYAWEGYNGRFEAASDTSSTFSFTAAERRRLHKKWTRARLYFDANFYLKEYPEVAATPFEAFMHYMHCGFSEDRQPRADFDGYYYRKTERLSRGQNPFQHCVDRLEEGQEFPANIVKQRGIQLIIRRRSKGASTLNGLKTEESQLSLCIHVHCFYVDLFNEVAERLRLLTRPFSLVVTVCSEADANTVRKLLGDCIQLQNAHILVVKNRGRDIAPFLVDSSPIWQRSDVVLHIHTKRSPHISWGDNWRNYLFDQTIGDEHVLKGVLDQFQHRNDLGMMYPNNYCMIRRFTEEEHNKEAIQTVAQKLHVESNFEAIGAYAAGSMAFYRVKALLSILKNEILEDLFEPEQGQIDGTTAHVLERLLPEVVRINGFQTQPYVGVNADLLVITDSAPSTTA